MAMAGGLRLEKARTSAQLQVCDFTTTSQFDRRRRNSPGVVKVEAMLTLLILSSSWTEEFDEWDAAAGRCGLGEMMSDMLANGYSEMRKVSWREEWVAVEGGELRV
jgi:hypothetical protein